jgi:hypothetical protein
MNLNLHYPQLKKVITFKILTHGDEKKSNKKSKVLKKATQTKARSHYSFKTYDIIC